MGLFDAMHALDQACPFDSLDSSVCGVEPPKAGFTEGLYGPDTSTFVDRWNEYSAQPRYIPNFDGIIDPFMSGMWNSPSATIENLYNGQMFGEPEKVDPNRIFSSDLTALKKIAADQAKLIAVFERKAMEMYTDKGQYGLNEDAIAAMQAVTSARSVLLSIAKEQAGIKKNITELKIKQQQAAAGPATPAQGGSGRNVSAFDIGRSVMDNIFNMPAEASNPVDVNYPTMDLNEASQVLESLVSPDQVPDTVKYEKDNPTTYVVVGDTDDDYEFVTRTGDGEIIPNYPVHAGRIVSVDREAKTAMDENLVPYKVEFRNE